MNFPEIQLFKFSKCKQLQFNQFQSNDKGKCSVTKNLNIIKMVGNLNEFNILIKNNLFLGLTLNAE